MSLVDLSLYLPVAKNCCVEPTEMEGLRGLILMESSSGPAVPEELIDEDPPQSVMPAAKHKPSKSVSDRRRVLATLEKCIFPPMVNSKTPTRCICASGLPSEAMFFSPNGS